MQITPVGSDSSSGANPIHNFGPERGASAGARSFPSCPEVSISRFLDDVLAGLAATPKSISCRWLYDDEGSEIFEEITRLEEYYPSRTEAGILSRKSRDIADFVGPDAAVLEYGAGAGVKSRLLLSALRSPSSYIPVDIAGDFLAATSAGMREAFPGLDVLPIEADFTRDFALPSGLSKERRVAFFPGSTIGNFSPREASALLGRMRRHTGPNGVAIVGADLRKEVDTLLAAYDDREGVTSRFNLNLLARINKELGGDFRPEAFAHEARWNAAESAVEMHLVSEQDQAVSLGGRSFEFQRGESIHTESSRKYDLESFEALVGGTGWRVDRAWSDDRKLFAVFGLEAE